MRESDSVIIYYYNFIHFQFVDLLLNDGSQGTHRSQTLRGDDNSYDGPMWLPSRSASQCNIGVPRGATRCLVMMRSQ